ncbi:FKBP12-associated protein [Tulasnella sp. 425]|nr:FKBP12-associated protein [Tulasnella sp. 425]
MHQGLGQQKRNGDSRCSIIAAFAAEWSIHDLAGSLHPTVAEKAAPDLESAANILVHCRTKKCYEITAGRERAVRGEEDDDDPRDDITGAFLCKRKCEASKNCGKHICGRVCCPLAALAGVGESSGKGKRRQRNAPTAEELAELDPEGWHVCDYVCGKPLPCGNHTCSERDHRGPCPTCLQASFEEVSE